MFFRQEKTFPRDKDRRDSILIDFSNDNPFPGKPATATAHNPPKKLFGRDREENDLVQVFERASSPDRPLIIIQGETGMGKSALTSYVFNRIRNGELDNSGQYYGAFVEAYGEVKDFRLLNFYFQILRSLEQFGMLKLISARMAKMIGQVIYHESASDFRDLFLDWDPYGSDASIIEILDNRKNVDNFLNNFMQSLGLFYPQIQKRWNKIDVGLIKTLLYSQAATIKRIDALEALQRGRKFEDYAISTDAEAKEALHALMNLLIAININSVLVLFIDQLEELFEITDPKKIAMKIFTLLLTLRQVPNLSIVLSGNLEAYDHLTSNLVGDTSLQLEHWQHYLYIHRLDDNEVGTIVHFLLTEFWRSKDLTVDVNFPYYPLSGETISYLYQKHERNLRATLIGLHDIFEDFKTNQKVRDLSDPISAIADLNILNDPLVLPLKLQQDFAEYMVSDKIQDKERSKIPEVAIHKLLEVVMKRKSLISDLKMSPSMPRTNKQPDIYYLLGGNLYHSDARRIGIEVKCYRKGTVIPKSDVEKTIVMLEQGDLDYVIWVSNVELHQVTINSMGEELKGRHIGITPQTDEQVAYTYWANIFEDAMKRKPSLIEAIELLEKIGIPRTFVEDPERLIETELLRQERLETSTTEEVEIEKPVSIQPGLDEIFDAGNGSNVSIGIDLHDKMWSYIKTEVENLISDGRKQIRKSVFYNNFLKKSKVSSKEVPEAEFVEIVEKLAKKNDNMDTTQKMLKLIY